MNENELLEIAKDVLEMNSYLSAKLSGSLMLFAMGLKKRRPATDIDIICEWFGEEKDEEGFPMVPKGFKLNNMDGNRSQVEAMQFINDEGIKIEFMVSGEMGEIIDGIPCAEISMMVLAKLNYAKNDKTPENRDKHLDDLIYLFDKNKSLQIS